MSWVHIHLMLSHLPVIGTVFGVLLLAYGVVSRRTELVEAALAAFVLLAVIGGAVFLTGEPAEEMAQVLAGFSEALVERHEEAGLGATVLLGAFGVVSFALVVGFRVASRPLAAWVGKTALLLALIPTAAMGYTAFLGGQIGHPEIRSSQDALLLDGDEVETSRDPLAGH